MSSNQNEDPSPDPNPQTIEKWKVQLGAFGMFLYSGLLLSVYIYFLRGMIKKKVWKDLHVFMLWLISLGCSDATTLSVLFIYSFMSMIGLDLKTMPAVGYWFLRSTEFLHAMGFGNIYPHIIGMSLFRAMAIFAPVFYKQYLAKFRVVLGGCLICWCLALAEAIREQFLPAGILVFDPGQFASVTDPKWSTEEFLSSLKNLALFWTLYMWLTCATALVMNVAGALVLYKRQRAAVAPDADAPSAVNSSEAPVVKRFRTEINLVLIGLILSTICIVEQYVWSWVMESGMKASVVNFLQRAITFTFFGLNPWLYWAICREIRKRVPIPLAKYCCSSLIVPNATTTIALSQASKRSRAYTNQPSSVWTDKN